MPDHVRRRKVWILPAVLMTAAAYLYVNLFRWPRIPYLLGGDQVFFWTDAQRMLHGERIYQDFFRFTPPGTDLVYLAAFKIFGPRLWVTNAIVLVLGVALCWMCFSIASQLMARTWAALSALLFLVFIYGPLLNGTHHWFSLLAVMSAARVLMSQRTTFRLTIAGGLFGIASFFTQTAGVVCLIALLIFLVLEGRHSQQAWSTIVRHQFVLLIAFILTVSALNVYFIATMGWGPIWEQQVKYPHYQTYWFGRLFPGLPDKLTSRSLPRLVPSLFVYSLLPVIYPLVLWRCWYRRHDPESPDTGKLTLVALIGLALLLEIIPAVNWLRAYAVSMPGLILLVWAATRHKRMRSYPGVLGSILIACLAAKQTWSKYHLRDAIVQLPAGLVVLSPEKQELYSWIRQHTHTGDYFLATFWPGVYLPLALRSPVFAEMLLNSDWTRPEYVELAIRQLEERQVTYILWTPRLNGPDDPARPWEDHLGPMRTYLLSRYKQVHVFADGDQIWQRNQTP